MSFSWKSFLTLAACTLALVAFPLRGQDDNGGPPPPASDNGAPEQEGSSDEPTGSVTFQTFYDSLSSLGTWIQTSDYGYVWQPQVNDPDWTPYTVGSWAYTDDGWTWVSDEPWGWATYHYGRWVNLDGIGWCWVPGYTWAPAWVSWRYGDGYVGWAPLPPDSLVGIDYSDEGSDLGVDFHIGGDCDAYYGIGAGWYVFLPVNCLGYRHYHGYYCNRGDNYAIINRTTNVTNLNVTRRREHNGEIAGSGVPRVTTGGPSLAQVNAVTQTPIQKVHLVRTAQPGGGGTLTNNSLALYAPHVNAGATAQPYHVTGTIGQATINRGIDIMRPLAVNPNITPSPATEAQVQQARIAQSHAPAGAKVVTDIDSVRPVLLAPVTSLMPAARPSTSTPAYTSPSTTTPVEREPTHVYYAPGPVYSPGPSSYQPHPASTETSGGTPTHQYVRPATPAPTVPSAPATPSAPVVHQSTSGGGANSNGGGATHTESSGGGGGGEGSTHASGSNGSNYQQTH
ncbi:MAG: hypothetical protein LV480_09665 [Methylacidiphilales bacterium]|nr:hypothetical protein [Candidatus Methylacidiphilales bacterium]